MDKHCLGMAVLRLTCWLAGLCLISVHAEMQQVQGIVGGAFTFPSPVISVGTLSYGNIGSVAIVVPGSSKTDLTEEFRGRLWWDSKTGLFTITDLQIQDSGQYKVDSSDGGKKVTEYQLTVYNRVSKPRVSASGSCWVLCSVENGRDVTLSWYRGTETLNQTSSPDLSTSLSLPLEVEHRYSYYCEAKNPASSQNLTLEIPANCSKTSGDIPSPRSFLIPVLVVCGLVLPIVIVIIIATCLKKRKRGEQWEDASASTRLHVYTDNTEYAEVIHSNQNHSQRQPVSELGPSSTPVKLTTVYEELRPTS
ncbi:SLAM family member 5-like isoform X3 [Brienomyrus brachyistius]|uniref:SLAM family member 5-like isoform X3 n=1 Tax=Brienomyrus brachyistius TaxID=42636 RepID=UPI0020B2BF1F|nr:SLAM family member 5-like isoform X3 [Brienomyrus brachyistius]